MTKKIELKPLIVAFFTIFLINSNANSALNEKINVTNIDSLIPFNVVVLSGDETIETSEIKIYQKADKFYADNITPFYYFGNKTDSIWTVELDEIKIAACINFLKKAKSLPKECPELSTSISEYTITSADESINIKGNCDWGDSNYFLFRQLIFEEKFTDLNLKRSKLIGEIDNQIIGDWYFQPLKTKLKNGDYFILTKQKKSNLDCLWQFGSQYSFKSVCNKVFDFTYSKKYLWRVDGAIYFEIQSGIITDKKGSVTVGNYGATFTLVKITDNELVFKFLWR